MILQTLQGAGRTCRYLITKASYIVPYSCIIITVITLAAFVLRPANHDIIPACHAFTPTYSRTKSISTTGTAVRLGKSSQSQRRLLTGSIKYYNFKKDWYLNIGSNDENINNKYDKEERMEGGDDVATSLELDEHEETLLRIAMKIKLKSDLTSEQHQERSIDDVIQNLCRYCQSYPFAAVLPVQPLQYYPLQVKSTLSSSSGTTYCNGIVEIQFLRKKTPERGSLDGGIRFYLLINPPDHENMQENSIHVSSQLSPIDTAVESVNIELIAKRNSHGQVIQKIMSEKIIITNFISSFLGKTSNPNVITTPQTTIVPSPIIQQQQEQNSILQIQSIYHKWM